MQRLFDDELRSSGVLEYDEVELIMGGDQISLLMKRALENRRARGVKIDVKVLERLVQQHCLEAEMTDYPFQHGAIDVRSDQQSGPSTQFTGAEIHKTDACQCGYL